MYNIKLLNYIKKLRYIIILFLLLNAEVFECLQKTEIGFVKFEKDGRELEYIDKYKSLKTKYSKDLFLYSFLKEISMTSYDYTKMLKKDNNCIHIMVSLNNKYIYPLIISITSALRNSNKNRTTLVYHILYSKDLRKKYINDIKSLLYLYPTNLVLIFYSIGDCFIQFKKQQYSQVTYYRLISPIFIPLDRIIYLDCDVLIFKDLYELYKTPLNNNYVLGFLDIISNAVDYLGLISEKYINAGVILLNLEKIRKDNKHYELLYMALNIKNLKNHDQTVINYVLYPKIGIIPFKFGIFNFPSIFDIKYLYLKKIRQKLNENELLKAFKDPSLIHFVLCYPKVWLPNSEYVPISTRNGTLYKSKCEKFHIIWMKYAKLTPFSDEIVKKYIFKINKSL